MTSATVTVPLTSVVGAPKTTGAVPVPPLTGPVAVAVVRESQRHATLWVVNHVSDSVSVVSLDTRTCQGEVIDTIHLGDEPRDILVAKNRAGHDRVFVTAAHRGQHHPIASAR